MSFIEDATGGRSYNTFKYGFDSIGVPRINYDEDEKNVAWQDCGETQRYTTTQNMKKLADQLTNSKPIITYFLDGSRRVYKVDDISYNKQVFPVVAGQVGVGCCKRIDKKMKKEDFVQKNILALPDKSHSGGWDEAVHFLGMTDKLNNFMQEHLSRFSEFCVLPYDTAKNPKKEVKLEDRGIAVVQDFMIKSEKEMVANLVANGKLNQDNYLLKDGSLEYKITKEEKADKRILLKRKSDYDFVIGVSKQFNPESCLDYKGKKNALYIADLPLFHRTPVARFKNDGISGDVIFGVWYIRLRDKMQTKTPFDGVIKVEKIFTEEEATNGGIDTDTVDLLSATLINERNPTCYGKDTRWANHLYPVFLTESFVKSKYLSTETFLNIF